MIKLSDAEWKIVTCLWDKGSMTIAELTKFYSNDTGWCRNAIITLLNRMEQKEAVDYTRENRTRRYFAKIDRTEAELEETTSFLDKVYNGNVGLMITNLIKSEKLSKEEIEELHKILEEN